MGPVPPTLLLGAAAVLPSVSRSDPPSYPWVLVPLVLRSPSSLWLNKSATVLYHHRKGGNRYTDLYFALFGHGTDLVNRDSLNIILHIFLFLSTFDSHFLYILILVDLFNSAVKDTLFSTTAYILSFPIHCPPV